MSGQIVEYRIYFILPTDLSLTRRCLIDIEQLVITADDLNRAGQHVLDWIACASLGKISDVGNVYDAFIDFNTIENHQKTDIHLHHCTAIGGRKCQWLDAISYNGALGNVLEMDDIHRRSILHPGPVIIPAALAMAEHVSASVDDFLKAVIKGYEVTIWLGQIMGPSHYKFFHNTSTCGALGAAMAVSSILKLDLQKTLWALGNAGSKTGGLWQMRNENVLTKQWHNSESARSGAMAGVLASRGLSGPEFILEGPQGIFNAMSSDAVRNYKYSLNSVDTDTEEPRKWHIYDCSFKPWPACRHAHPAIDAMLHIINQHNLTPGVSLSEQVKSIKVEVYRDAQVFCDNPMPETELQAKFSIQHALAAVVKWGDPKLVHYAADAFNNSAIVELRDKVSISCNEIIQSHYPQHFGVKCTLILKHEKPRVVILKDTLGDPERPLTKLQLRNKASMLLKKAGMNSINIKSLCEFDWLANNDISSLTRLLSFKTTANE